MALDINLNPKQLTALTTPANEILYGGAVGGGKALDVKTPIITTEGWKTIETLKVGDKVFDERGIPCNVVAKSDIVYDNTYRVTFDRGISIVCDGRHQWRTSTRKERVGIEKGVAYKKGNIRTTEEIKNTLLASEGRANHSISVTRPLQFPEKEQPVDPYFFGMWLNNGFYYDKKKKRMLQRYVSAGSPFSIRTYKGGIYQNKERFDALMATTGVSLDDPYIPDEYLFASEEQRREFLRGYLDVSGTVDFSGKVNITFTSERMAHQVHFLLVSLGIKAKVLDFLFESNKTDAKWRMQFRADKDMFKVKWRKEKLKRSYPETRQIHRQFYVKNVEKIDDVPKQCIQVDSPSHMYLAGEHLIPTHNSFLMRVAAIVWAMECPGLQIYLFRLTRKELEDNHMIGKGSFHDLLGDAINSGFVKINSNDYQIQFKNGPNGTFMNGSIIHLCHCQYEKDKYKYHGAEMDVLMIDEVTHFTHTKYEYLRTRVRTPNTWKPPQSFIDKWGENFFPRILLGTNPGGVSHNWFRREFVKIAPPMTIVRMPKNKGGMLRQFIPATLDDNPYIDRDIYEGKVMAVGNEATAKMLLNGDWDAIAGGMFDDVWNPKIHMVVPFDIPESWYVDRAMDWGSSDPFSIGWYAESDGTEITNYEGETITYPAGTLFRVAEWYGWTGEENVGLRLTPWEVGAGIKKIEEENPVFKNVRHIYPGPADNQIWNHNSKQDSAYTSIAHEINAGYYNRESFKSFDIFTRSDKSQGSNIRGWAMLRTYLKNSLSYPIIDRKSIFFFNTCVHVPRVLPTIERDENNIEEIAKHQEDHIVDELKYRVTYQRQLTKRVRTRLG